eukprot:CAMPEP_0172679154 /NCGR_PEP_ID=MMETSP1074-20121228/15874_1 /TAXON_ID=2916 /ORGANISM="Ceratium fusus, Strain PA161109" /LENGTH=228 /DNA_ID=CAMNT_0013497281 /DNA_START=228 /DNA_END=913 /DNA_ORIENTATION=+
MAARIHSQTPSMEPPPLPPRPPELPPTNRLPRMVSNDEGEVFWYVPKPKQMQHPGSISLSGNSAAAQPKGAQMSLVTLPPPACAGDDDVAFPSPESDAPRSVGAKPAAAASAASIAPEARSTVPKSRLAATMEDVVDMSPGRNASSMPYSSDARPWPKALTSIISASSWCHWIVASLALLETWEMTWARERSERNPQGAEGGNRRRNSVRHRLGVGCLGIVKAAVVVG